MNSPETEFEKQLADEIAAIDMMLFALIATHPDKRTLLATFDALIANVQVQVSLSVGPVRPGVRDALQRFRAQIEAALSAD